MRTSQFAWKRNPWKIIRKRKINRKAQMTQTETIAVLFIFFVLLVFGIIFYYQYSQSALKEKQEELFQKRVMETTLKAFFLPELICSKGEAEPEGGCLDVKKLRYANETVNDHLEKYYQYLFSYAKISVQEVYPGNHSWILYNYEKKKTLENGSKVPNWKNKETNRLLVSLREEGVIENKPFYSFGYLSIEVYS